MKMFIVVLSLMISSVAHAGCLTSRSASSECVYAQHAIAGAGITYAADYAGFNRWHTAFAITAVGLAREHFIQKDSDSWREGLAWGLGAFPMAFGLDRWEISKNKTLSLSPKIGEIGRITYSHEW